MVSKIACVWGTASRPVSLTDDCLSQRSLPVMICGMFRYVACIGRDITKVSIIK